MCVVKNKVKNFAFIKMDKFDIKVNYQIELDKIMSDAKLIDKNIIIVKLNNNTMHLCNIASSLYLLPSLFLFL